MVCPRCQVETGPSAVRCPSCGAPLALPREPAAARLDRALELDRRGPAAPRVAVPPPPAPPPAPALPQAAPPPRAAPPHAAAPSPAAVTPPAAAPPRAAAPPPAAPAAASAATPSGDPHEPPDAPGEPGAVVELERAGTGRRVAAWVVDGLPFGLAALALVGWLGVDAGALLASILAVVALASFVYQALAHWLLGATLGKRLLGLAVVGPSGERPGPGRSALRAGAAVAGVALLGVGPLLALFTRTGRGLHDLVAGTAVVRAP